MSDGTYYTVLGISEVATRDEIEQAFLSLVAAYRVLSDSAERSAYDQELVQARQQRVLLQTTPSSADIPCPLYPEIFSKRTGFSVREAEDFLTGRVPIGPSLARKLQSDFGSSLEFWMSQPFNEDSISPFAAIASALFLVGLGCGLFALMTAVFAA